MLFEGGIEGGSQLLTTPIGDFEQLVERVLEQLDLDCLRFCCAGAILEQLPVALDRREELFDSVTAVHCWHVAPTPSDQSPVCGPCV